MRFRATLGLTLAACALTGCQAALTPAPSRDSTSIASAHAHGERVLYYFSGPPDGKLPVSGHLILDSAGNLYGTTSIGGTGTCKFRGIITGCGTVFELSPVSGSWIERVLYDFKNLPDGAAPYGTLALDSGGNIYGVTVAGGNHGCVPLSWVYAGCGTVFELMPNGASWTKHTLHIFSGGADGGNPLSGPVIDAGGNLLGTAYCGGASYSCYSEGAGSGLFFELVRKQSWQFQVLYDFGKFDRGTFPMGDLTQDHAGRIYGNAENIYEMAHVSPKRWRYTQLLLLGNNRFAQGYHPNGGLAFDASGNIYGTMEVGGNAQCNCGLVYEAIHTQNRWTEHVLHTFTGASDGARPYAGLTIDASGHLYGTASNGGDLQCNNGAGCGVIFEMYAGGSSEVERVLHAFKDDASDGGMPAGALIFGSRSEIYGTTEYGGHGPNLGDGTVFEASLRSLL